LRARSAATVRKGGGDRCICQQPTAENGEIVAAMIDGEATVKAFEQAGGHV
jgi:SOS-response transcriptional repressor LexA